MSSEADVDLVVVADKSCYAEEENLHIVRIVCGSVEAAWMYL